VWSEVLSPDSTVSPEFLACRYLPGALVSASRGIGFFESGSLVCAAVVAACRGVCRIEPVEVRRAC